MLRLALLLSLLVSLAGAAERPQITTSGGNLYFEASDGKNIEFRPAGSGQIKVGKHNLMYLTDQFANMSSALTDIRQSLKQNVTELSNRLNNIRKSMHFLYLYSHRRITNLESIATNHTSYLRNLNYTLQTLRHQEHQLSERANRLENQIAHLDQVLARNPCESYPCANGGSCTTHYSRSGYQEQITATHRCLCTDEWAGQNCTEDKNECHTFESYLRQYGKKHHRDCANGQCINRPGTYDCHCNPGFYGVLCDQTEDVCANNDVAMCGQGGICVSSGSSHKCICRGAEGFYNEDAKQPASRCVRRPCQASTCWRQGAFKAECIERPEPPYYTCRCPRGFHGDGESCEDVDECASYESPCPVGKFCRNNIGSYECQCSFPNGFDNNGTCVYMGRCRWQPCRSFERCTPEGSYSYKCDCLEGWTKTATGNSCQLTNETQAYKNCTSLRLCNYGSCRPDDVNGYRCECDVGYTGPTCSEQKLCPDQNFCQNSGQCTFNVYGQMCNCPTAYTGWRCQTRTNPCGGVRSDSSGVITFDYSVYGKLHDSSCHWEIKAEPEYQIKLVFTKFKLLKSTNCQDEYLQIDNNKKMCSVQSHYTYESKTDKVSLYLKKHSMTDRTTELVVQYSLVSPPQLADCSPSQVGNFKTAGTGSVSIPGSNWTSTGTTTSCTLRIFLPEFDSRSETVFKITGNLDERVTCNKPNIDDFTVSFYKNNSDDALPVVSRGGSSCNAIKRIEQSLTGVYSEAVITAQLTKVSGTTERSKSKFQLDWWPLHNCTAFENSHSAMHGVLHFTEATAHCSRRIVYPLYLPFDMLIRKTSDKHIYPMICLSVRAVQ